MGAFVFLLGRIAFAAIGVAVGWQLVAEARRGEGWGLHTVALGAIAVGGLGLLAMPLAEALGSEAVSLAGEIAVRAAMLLLCFFIAGTFRPGPVGVAGAGLCSALLIATLVWDVLAQPSQVHYDYTRPSSHANQIAAAIPFAWSSVEAGALWRRTRRRIRIGLGDPVLAERFLLWSAITACFVAICGLAIAAGTAAAAGSVARADLAQGLRGGFYLAITGLVWRARFAAPRASEAEPGAGQAG